MLKNEVHQTRIVQKALNRSVVHPFPGAHGLYRYAPDENILNLDLHGLEEAAIEKVLFFLENKLGLHPSEDQPT